MTAGKRIILYICAVIAGITAAVCAAGMLDIIKVRGTAMEPSVREDSRVIINRMAYFFRQPESGEAVAFACDVYSEDEEGGILVRRVAAVEGDKVEIKDGNLYVNGKCHEQYAELGVYLEPMEEITVGKNRVFVLSDTGKAVLDSRDNAVGQLRTDELMGRVWFK